MEAVTHEFYESLCWAFYSFSFGIFLREFAPSAFGQWLGRAGVLCAMVVMVLFGTYSIRQCSMLASNSNTVSGKGISHAKREDEGTSAPSEAGRKIRTPAGHIVTVKFDSDTDARSTGNDRSVPRTASRSQWSFGGYRQRDGSIGRGIADGGRTTGGVGRLPFAEPSLSDLK